MMVYLTLTISEYPVVPALSARQKIYAWAQTTVPEAFHTLTAQQTMDYLIPLGAVIGQDLEAGARSKPTTELADETPSSD